jgi:hypothetical protein
VKRLSSPTSSAAAAALARGWNEGHVATASPAAGATATPAAGAATATRVWIARPASAASTAVATTRARAAIGSGRHTTRASSRASIARRGIFGAGSRRLLFRLLLGGWGAVQRNLGP